MLENAQVYFERVKEQIKEFLDEIELEIEEAVRNNNLSIEYHIGDGEFIPDIVIDILKEKNFKIKDYRRNEKRILISFDLREPNIKLITEVI